MSTVCRVCLTGGGGTGDSNDAVMLSVEDIKIKEIYHMLTKTQFNSEDGRPKVVCTSCYENLLKCWNLSQIARKSEDILSILLYRKIKATNENIKKLNLETEKYVDISIELDNILTRENSSANSIIGGPNLVTEKEFTSGGLIGTESTSTIYQEKTHNTEILQIYELLDSDSSDTEDIKEIHDLTRISSENLSRLIEHAAEVHTEPQQIENDSDELILDRNLSSNDGNNLLEHSTEMDIAPVTIEKDSEENSSQTFCSDSYIQMPTHTKENQCKTYDKKLSDFTKRVDTRNKPLVKPKSCNVCDKQVTRTRICTGEKPYACNICLKQYKHKSSIYRHMKSSHWRLD